MMVKALKKRNPLKLTTKMSNNKCFFLGFTYRFPAVVKNYVSSWFHCFMIFLLIKNFGIFYTHNLLVQTW